METLTGIVKRIVFYSPEDKYIVLAFETVTPDETVTICGNMGSIYEGCNLIVKGNWFLHKRFGRQFKVEQYEETIPKTLEGIKNFLEHGPFVGIGPVCADIIVEYFREETIHVIDNEPERLTEVPGIGKKRAAWIIESWQKNRELKDIIHFSGQYDIRFEIIKKVYAEYGGNTIDEVKKNPYQLIDDIRGIGFRKADNIALKLGIGEESLFRCCAGILHVLKENTHKGHCHMYCDSLIDETIELLGVSESFVLDAIDELIDTKEIIEEEYNDDTIYSKASVYHSEVGIAKRLVEIDKATGQHFSLDVEKFIVNFQKKTNIRYDRFQIRAIKKAIQSKVMKLSGLPGTGKTTVQKCVAAYFEQCGAEILLAAPTGRASKRLSEATGMQAKTIHMLLEAKNNYEFGKDKYNKLSGDLLIIDEMSMVDCFLFYHLLQAVPDSIRILLVGDSNQLPSIGAGNVLKDLIDTRAIPHAHLKNIHRQGKESQIINNAHRINNGEMPDLNNPFDGDFFFIQEPDNESIADTIVELCAERLPGYNGIKPSDIQVLTPQHKTEVGTEILNKRLQSALNKNSLSIKHFETTFVLGDKVIHKVNDYGKNVRNGDIGFINGINLDDETVTVDYDDHTVTYERFCFNEIELAYAITIHKSQGSEYPVVVIPMTMSHYSMLQRNLLYTAVTRGKQMVVLVGDKRAIRKAVKNNSTAKRNTLLTDRILEYFEDSAADISN